MNTVGLLLCLGLLFFSLAFCNLQCTDPLHVLLNVYLSIFISGVILNGIVFLILIFHIEKSFYDDFIRNVLTLYLIL